MKFKRTVSVILAFLMIAGMIPLSAMAAGSPETYGISDGESTASEPEALCENVPQRVELDKENGTKTFSFTPDVSGKYTFFSDNSSFNGQINITLYDADNNYMASWSNIVSSTLTEKTTYKIDVTYFSYNFKKSDCFDFAVVKATPPTSIEMLDKSEIETYVNTYDTLGIKANPWYADCTGLTWTVGDESIATITYYPQGYNQQKTYGCNFKSNAVGTTTITIGYGDSLKVQYTITVKNYESISLDEVGTAVIGSGGLRTYFSFTPEESGYYSFSSEEKADTYGRIWDENLTEPILRQSSGDGFKVNCEMTAGETYILETGYNDSTKTGSFNVSVSKTLLADGISIAGSLKGYVGTSDYLSVTAKPEGNFYGNISWSSSNENVATVDRYGRVMYIAAGTTTITATSQTKLTAACEVTVSEPETLSENSSCRIEADKNDRKKAFYFTPSEDGRHTFYCDNFSYIDQYNGNDTWIVLYEPGNSSVSSASYCLTYNLQKEKTYVICVSYSGGFDETISYDLIAAKAVPPTDVKLLDESTVELYPNMNAYNSLRIRFEPWYADCGNVTWTSDDDSIVSIKHDFSGNDYQRYYGCNLNPKSAGTTTVIATAENGTSAQYTVIVKDYENISLDETKSAVIDSPNKILYFKFTPDEDGYYSFSSEADSYTYGRILDENLNELASPNYWGSNFNINCKMTAGTTYILEARYNDGSRIDAFEVTVSRSVLANEISITNRLNGYVGTSEYLYVSATPEGSAYGKIKWSSSNEAVAAVDQNGQVSYKAAGKATVTAESEIGLKAACEITVSKPEVLTENIPFRVEINENNEEKAFTFTPSEDGRYTFYCENYSSNMASTRIRLFNTVGDNIYSDSCCLTYTLKKGMTYTISTNFSYNPGNKESYDLVAVKAAPPTAIEPSGNSEFETYINTEGRLSVKFDKWYADCENVTWTSDNESVVSITSNYSFTSSELQKGYMCSFKTSGLPGKATVTVTSKNGLTAQYTITVKDYENISAGETKSAVIGHADARSYFRFTPKENGYYSFYSDEDSYTYGRISDESLNELASDNHRSWKSSFKVKYEMQAGTTYILEAGYNDGSKTGSFNITVEKAKTVAKLEIASLPYRMDYIKGFVKGYIVYDGLTLKATWSDGTTTTEECYNSYGDFPNVDFDGDTVNFDLSAADEDGIVKISCGSAETQFKLRLKENTVVGLEVVGTDKHRYIENCNGYYRTVFNMNNEPQEQYYYYYFCPEVTIKVNYKNGSSETVTMDKYSNGHLYLDGYSVYCEDNQEEKHWTVGSDNYYTVTYLGYSVPVRVTIETSPVESIKVISGTSKRLIENLDGWESTYYPGNRDPETFFYYSYDGNDVSDAVIQINYKSGSPKTAHIGDVVDGFRINVDDDQYNNHWKLGSDNYLTVSYMGKETKLPITVIANPVDHIEVISAPSRVYYYGDEAFGDYYPEDDSYHFYPTDLTGLTVKVYYTDKTSKTFTVKNGERYGEFNRYSYSISFDGEENGWHSPEIGDFPVTFHYMGHSADYNVTVVDSPVDSVSVTKNPSKTVYNSAFAPILDGMEVTVKYKNGKSKTVTLTAENTSRRFTFADENTRYDYIYIDGHPLIIKQENYYNIGNESSVFSLSYLGAKTELKNIFSYVSDEITDVTVTNFNRYTLEFDLTVKYESGKTETLKIAANQINGDDDNYWHIMCYAVTPNGLLYFDIQSDGNYKVSACDIDILGKTVHIPAKQSIYDINCDGKADAQDLVLLRTALLNSADLYQSPELDINGDGDVNILDLIRLKKYISGAIKVGDVNGDRTVNILDLIRLKKHIATDDSLESSEKTASPTQ